MREISWLAEDVGYRTKKDSLHGVRRTIQQLRQNVVLQGQLQEEGQNAVSATGPTHPARLAGLRIHPPRQFKRLLPDRRTAAMYRFRIIQRPQTRPTYRLNTAPLSPWLPTKVPRHSRSTTHSVHQLLRQPSATFCLCRLKIYRGILSPRSAIRIRDVRTGKDCE
jgi:hypothetical protein